MVTRSARDAFSYADSYETRKSVYFTLPEPDVPFAALEVQIILTLISNPNPNAKPYP